MIDYQCHACKMKISHHQHDKRLRVQHRSKHTEQVIHYDYDKGPIVIRKRIKN